MSSLPSGSVSLCMIVKNESGNLRPCLRPVAGLFAERIVVDTGSTDDTRAVAAGLGARVYDFPWRDDFSAARNEALRHAQGDWIFWLDADDRLDAVNAGRLGELLAGLGDQRVAYVMNTVCTARHASDSGTVISHARLFRRHSEIRWQGRVHEQVLPSIQRLGHELVWTDIRLEHTGYGDPALAHRKANRDLRLLRLEYAVAPDDPAVLFHLALAHLRLGQHAAALPFLQRSLELATTRGDWVRKLFAALAETLLAVNRFAEALAVTAQGVTNFPHDPQLTILRADLLGKSGDLRGAEHCLEGLIDAPPQKYFQVGVPEDLVRKEARRLLAVIYQDQGRFAESERILHDLLAEYPDYAAAWVNLGYVRLAAGDLDAVEGVSGRLDACPQGEPYACVMRAELQIAGGALDRARPLLDRALALAPQMLWPRIVLSEWLEKNGDDPAGLMASLRDILRLQPGNAFARERLRRLSCAAPATASFDAPLSWTIVAS